jgi:hypothetical protein
MRTMQPDGRNATDRHWRRQAVLSDAVLEPLYELNHAYLLMLARVPRQWRSPSAVRLPDPVCIALMSLAPDERDAVARCPFSLFNAQLHDEGLWSQLAQPGGVEERPSESETDQLRVCLSAFAQLALFFVWHLAHSNAAAARVVFGMSERTLAIFQRLTLTRVQQIALERPDLLVPRWPERTTFWKELLQPTPSRSDGEVASDVRLLGLQMLAAEMPKAAERAPSR